MSTFKGHAKSLEEQYVFYQRLKTDGYYPKLSQYVSSASYRIYTQTQKYSADTSAVRAQAQAEFTKEKMLLQQKFGVNINFDYYRNQDDFKEIIEALNACLNLKEVYERNIQLIKNTNMKGVFSWYPTYFMHAWQEYWPQIKSEFYQLFLNGQEASSALNTVLDRLMPDICVLGIQKMLDGPEVEHASVDENLKTAYSSLISQIGDVYTAGSVAHQLYNAYQLDKLKESLSKELKVKDNKIYANDIRPKVKKIVSKQMHPRGGLSLEAIENAIFSMVASGVEGGGSAIHSGSKGIKADNILTLSIDPSIVVDALEQAGANREENIRALSALGAKLSNLNDGFIVYSSDKNWTLNNEFSGYDAGSTGKNAADFLNNVYQADSSVSTLIGAIQQLGKGAMLEGRKAEFEKLLAQDVAYMLFDDFTTIGTVSTGGNAIHIMNLNGIMMPMSVFLSMLADSIESVKEDEIRRLVNVNISAPSILWDDPKGQEKQEAAFPGNSHGAWEYQRQYTLDNTKITVKFLRDFKSFISSLL